MKSSGEKGKIGERLKVKGARPGCWEARRLKGEGQTDMRLGRCEAKKLEG